ncbi:MAG: hypothetical protein Q7U91_09065 [Sideroxyarcus sp.]|nr:hypothetical protein [Sideroxyarcus sp.]
MQYVPSITPITANPETREVKGLTQIHAVKRAQRREQTEPEAKRLEAHQEEMERVERHYREHPGEDRRKICRRVSHLPVLVELRSGIDRRRHNLRGSDIVEHIDETA